MNTLVDALIIENIRINNQCLSELKPAEITRSELIMGQFPGIVQSFDQKVQEFNNLNFYPEAEIKLIILFKIEQITGRLNV